MREARLLVLVTVLASAVAQAHFPFGSWDTSQSPNVLVVNRVDVRALPGGVLKFYLSEDPPRILASGDTLNALAGTLGQALALWSAVPNSTLRLELAGIINTSMPRPQAFPAGILRFTEEVPPGALATGGFLSGPRNTEGNFFPITGPQVNFPVDMSGVPSSGRSFLVGVTHEVGHSIGLKHTLPLGVMYQSVTPSRAKVLWPDDEAGLASLYPTAGFATSTATIAGRVISAGSPAAVASVTAMGTSGDPVIGSYTAPDGSYRITGLPPGSYKLAVQPLPLGAVPSSAAVTPGDPNDLISIRTLTGLGVQINTNIDSQFFGGTFDPAASPDVTVSAGETRTGADFDVAARGPARLEALAFSATLPSGRGISPALLVPGSSMRVTATGIGLSTAMQLSALGPGIVVDPASLRSVTVAPRAHINSGVSFQVNTDAGAVAGPRTLLMSSGADHYLAPGYLIVAAGQPPSISSLSPASGPPGTAVTILGSSFASGARVFFDGVPATDVKVVDAGTIQAVAPLQAPGSAARVFVYHPDGFGSDMLAAPLLFQYATGTAPAISIQPASARPGESLIVTITGADTHFSAGQTTVGLGGGDVAVESFTVKSPTEITAGLRVAATVRSTRYDLGAVTAGEFVTLRNAFRVETASPASVARVSGNNQIGPISATLGLPVVVRVLDAAGSPVEGAEVAFAFTSGTGQANPPKPTSDQFGVAQATITLGPEAGAQAVTASAGGAGVAFSFTAVNQPLPVISAGGLVNAASYAPAVAPGAIVSIFGSGLATSTAGASSLPLPSSLGGAVVRINGFAAPLFYVSPGQINAQAPYTVAGSLQVTVTAGPLTSDMLSAALAGAAPGIFTVNQSGGGPGVVLHADFSPVTQAAPAQRGEVVLVFATGLGAVQPGVNSGFPAPGPSLVTQTTTASVGGVNVGVEFSGLAPGYVGLYQVNVKLPDPAPTGDAVDLRITVGGRSSNTVTIAVR